ncbi:MAG: hypothetical protein ABI210_05075 [Abditibacteriaceae bacterium]
MKHTHILWKKLLSAAVVSAVAVVPVMGIPSVARADSHHDQSGYQDNNQNSNDNSDNSKDRRGHHHDNHSRDNQNYNDSHSHNTTTVNQVNVDVNFRGNRDRDDNWHRSNGYERNGSSWNWHGHDDNYWHNNHYSWDGSHWNWYGHNDAYWRTNGYTWNGAGWHWSVQSDDWYRGHGYVWVNNSWYWHNHPDNWWISNGYYWGGTLWIGGGNFGIGLQFQNNDAYDYNWHIAHGYYWRGDRWYWHDQLDDYWLNNGYWWNGTIWVIPQNNVSHDGYGPFRSFTGVVTHVDHGNNEFDIRINDDTYNVYPVRNLPNDLTKGEIVKVHGQRYGHNDIRNSDFTITDN